jgi:hypothetical protein
MSDHWYYQAHENPKIKEGMKTKQFNKEVGATTGCTLRLPLNTIPPQLATVKHGVHGDAWFGGVKTANEVRL